MDMPAKYPRREFWAWVAFVVGLLGLVGALAAGTGIILADALLPS